jgi:SAM-dependent methyltransferase
MSEPLYYDIIKHYEECLSKHGATAKGMDWPNELDLIKRFEVMLGVVRKNSSRSVSLLDLGCGAGLLVDHLLEKGITNDYKYHGIDISEKMIATASNRHPKYSFETRDILINPLPPQSVDYIIMNGLLTEKKTLNNEQMEEYAGAVIKTTFDACGKGIAFNVMSYHVDWFREDLFHWPLDSAVDFLIKACSRHLVIRMDYGLYEYTVYVYREAN